MKLLLSGWRSADVVQQTLMASELWPSLKWQGQEIRFKEPVQLSLELTGEQGSLLVRGEIAAELELACSRCAEDFVLPMRLTMNEVIPLASDEDQDGCWNFAYLDRERDELDLSELSIQVLLENLPLQPLCSQECRGLCPICGKNLNSGDCDCQVETIDPRLAILRQLLNQNQQAKK